MIAVKTGPCEAVWCVPRRNIRRVGFFPENAFAEWKCHIHNHFHVVELPLPTTEITEQLLKNAVLVLFKSSRSHSLQEILDPCLKTWMQLLWCHKCIKSKCMLSPVSESHSWASFNACLCEFAQGARREYEVCVQVYGFVLGQGYWESKGDPSASRMLS